MAKFEERENRRRASVVRSIVKNTPPAAGKGRGRPKVDREIKKRISLSIMPSLYEDVQKIAYIQRKSISDLVGELMEQYREEHEKELAGYEEIKNRGGRRN